MRISWVPVKSVATVRVSNVDKKTVEGDQPVRLCNYTDVYYNDAISEDMSFMSATATREQIRIFGLRKDDVVVTKDSETAEDIGIAAYVKSSDRDLVCGYHLAILRPNRTRIHGRFLYWSLVSRHLRDQFAVSATGVTRFGLRSESIASVRVALCSLEKQVAIAEFLDTETARVDALIAKKHRLEDAIMARVLTSIESVIWAPRYNCVPLRRVCHFIDYRGATPSKSDSGVPLITASHIRDGWLDLRNNPQWVDESTYKEWMRRGWPAVGDVLLTTEAPLGNVAQITESRVALAQRVILLKPNESAVLADFLALALRAPTFRNVLSAHATGSTALGIKADRLKALNVPVPPLGVQLAHVSEIMRQESAANRARNALMAQIALLRERKQALITAAVTGEMDVPGVSA